jgi:hypothetical protein
MPAYALTMEGATTLLLGIRLFARFQHSSDRFGLDDIFIIAAWAIATINISLIITDKLYQ